MPSPLVARMNNYFQTHTPRPRTEHHHQEQAEHHHHQPSPVLAQVCIRDCLLKDTKGKPVNFGGHTTAQAPHNMCRHIQNMPSGGGGGTRRATSHATPPNHNQTTQTRPPCNCTAAPRGRGTAPHPAPAAPRPQTGRDPAHGPGKAGARGAGAGSGGVQQVRMHCPGWHVFLLQTIQCPPTGRGVCWGEHTRHPEAKHT